MEKLIEMAATPDAEWRLLCSSMAYYLRHPERTERPEIIGAWFDEMPSAEDWTRARLAVTALRLAGEEAAFKGEPLDRREYMRLYMKRKRLEKAV